MICPNGVCGVMSPKPTVVRVTIHQYTLFGILSKPCSFPSIRYITVPRIMVIISTASMKTDILALLAFSAETKWLDADKNRTSFNILKTRNNRIALKATRACVPTNIKDKYFGMVDSKSITP